MWGHESSSAGVGVEDSKNKVVPIKRKGISTSSVLILIGTFGSNGLSLTVIPPKRSWLGLMSEFANRSPNQRASLMIRI